MSSAWSAVACARAGRRAATSTAGTADAGALPVEPVELARREAHLQAWRIGLEEGRLHGFEQGHADGLARGRHEAAQEAARQAAAAREAQERAVEAWVQATRAIDGLWADLLREAEAELAVLAAQLLTRLVGEALGSPHGVAARVGCLLAELPQRGLAVRIAPALLPHLPDAPARGMRWIPDPALGPGDCMVETAMGTLEARLEQVLRDILDALRQAADAAAAARPGARELRA
jgi:flagellar assembly protein FliH